MFNDVVIGDKKGECEALVDDTSRGQPEVSEINRFQCHSVHHKFHMDWPGIDTWPPQREAGETNAWAIAWELSVRLVLSQGQLATCKSADGIAGEAARRMWLQLKDLSMTFMTEYLCQLWSIRGFTASNPTLNNSYKQWQLWQSSLAF